MSEKQNKVLTICISRKTSRLSHIYGRKIYHIDNLPGGTHGDLLESSHSQHSVALRDLSRDIDDQTPYAAFCSSDLGRRRARQGRRYAIRIPEQRSSKEVGSTISTADSMNHQFNMLKFEVPVRLYQLHSYNTSAQINYTSRFLAQHLRKGLKIVSRCCHWCLNPLIESCFNKLWRMVEEAYGLRGDESIDLCVHTKIDAGACGQHPGFHFMPNQALLQTLRQA